MTEEEIDGLIGRLRDMVKSASFNTWDGLTGNGKTISAAADLIAAQREALDAARYYIDAHDEELAEAGITRGDALFRARLLRQSLGRTL